MMCYHQHNQGDWYTFLFCYFREKEHKVYETFKQKRTMNRTLGTPYIISVQELNVESIFVRCFASEN